MTGADLAAASQRLRALLVVSDDAQGPAAARPLARGAPGDHDDQCVVCLSADRSHAFAPCGHVAVCGECADLLQATAKGRGEELTCPLCRAVVAAVVLVQRVARRR